MVSSVNAGLEDAIAAVGAKYFEALGSKVFDLAPMTRMRDVHTIVRHAAISDVDDAVAAHLFFGDGFVTVVQMIGVLFAAGQFDKDALCALF